MLAPSRIISLAACREALAERFPQAPPLPERQWLTGWEAIDVQEGGLQQAAINELCSSPACGGLFLDRVLASIRQQRSFAGLVDAGRTFDPRSYAAASLARVLSVFCATAEQGVKVTDLLLRDGNLPLVLLDLQAVPLRDLGRIPANAWHRFQRLVEKSGTTLVVMTPQPIVEAARVRITLTARWNVAALKRPRGELLAGIEARLFRRGRQAAPIAAPRLHTA